MFDFRLLRIRSFTAANTTMMLVGATMGGALFLLPIFLISVLGYSELKAAIAITPMPLTALILGPFVGRLTDRIGPRLPAAVGSAFFGVGMLLLAQLGGQSTALSVGWRVVFLGVGMGCVFPSVSSAAMGSLPPQVSGVGSGALNTLRQIGFSLGIAVLVAIFSHQVVVNVTDAAQQSQRFVQTQTVLPASARQQIGSSLAKTVAAAKQGGGTSISASDALAGAPTAAPGTPMAAGASQAHQHHRWPLPRRHREVVQVVVLRRIAGGLPGAHPGSVHGAPDRRARGARSDVACRAGR